MTNQTKILKRFRVCHTIGGIIYLWDDAAKVRPMCQKYIIKGVVAGAVKG